MPAIIHTPHLLPTAEITVLPESPAVYLLGPTDKASEWTGPALELLDKYAGDEKLHVIDTTPDQPSELQILNGTLPVWSSEQRLHVADLGTRGVFACWVPRPTRLTERFSERDYLRGTYAAWKRICALKREGPPSMRDVQLIAGIDNRWSPSPALTPIRRGAAKVGYEVTGTLEEFCRRAAWLAGLRQLGKL